MRKTLSIVFMLVCGWTQAAFCQSISAGGDAVTSNDAQESISTDSKSNVLPTNGSIEHLRPSSELVPRPEPEDSAEIRTSNDNGVTKPTPRLDFRSSLQQKTGTAQETQPGDDSGRPDILPYKYGPSARSFWAAWGIAAGAMVANTEIYERYKTGMYRPEISRGVMYSIGTSMIGGFIGYSEPRLRHEPYRPAYKKFAGAVAAAYTAFALGTVVRRSR